MKLADKCNLDKDHMYMIFRRVHDTRLVFFFFSTYFYDNINDLKGMIVNYHSLNYLNWNLHYGHDIQPPKFFIDPNDISLMEDDTLYELDEDERTLAIMEIL